MTTQINYSNASTQLSAIVSAVRREAKEAGVPLTPVLRGTTRAYKSRLTGAGQYNVRVKLYGGVSDVVGNSYLREKIVERAQKVFGDVQHAVAFDQLGVPSIKLHLRLPAEALATSPKSAKAPKRAKAKPGTMTVTTAEAVKVVDAKLQAFADATIPSGAFDGLAKVSVNRKNRTVSIAGLGSATYPYGQTNHFKHRTQYKVVGNKLQRTATTEVYSVLEALGLSSKSRLTPDKAAKLAKAFAAASEKSAKVVWATKAEVTRWVEAERNLRQRAAKLIGAEAERRMFYTNRKLKAAQTEVNRATKAWDKAQAHAGKVRAALS